VDVFMCRAGAAGGSQQGDRYHRYICPLSHAPARSHTRARTHTLDLWRKCDCGTETRNTRPLKEHKTVSACAHTLMRSHTDSYMHAHARTHSHTNDHAAQVSGH